MAKRAKKTGKKRASAKRTKRASTAKRTVSKSKNRNTAQALSVEELRMELQRRQRGVAKLERKRERLMSELADVNAQIGELGGTSGTGGRTRARNRMTLPDALAEVLSGRTMSVTEAADAVRASGYQTTAENFRTMVNQALIKDKRFKKISRGHYTA